MFLGWIFLSAVLYRTPLSKKFFLSGLKMNGLQKCTVVKSAEKYRSTQLTHIAD